MTTLSVVEFGEVLLKSGDLDPVYLAINSADLSRRIKDRLCLSYWCFYHLGAAARMAEAKSERAYWEMMQEAAAYSPVGNAARPWPRGAERRHYRGAQSVSSMSDLVGQYGAVGASGAVSAMLGPHDRSTTFKQVSARVRAHRGFGAWIAFKIADMGERVLDRQVDFSACELGIYKDPRQGAALVYYENLMTTKPIGSQSAPWAMPITDDQLAFALAHYTKVFCKHKVDGRRPVNVQEVETIWCKYKSYWKGHYPPGKDTLEIGHGLEGWGDLAQQLKKGLPTWPPTKSK